MSDVHPAPSVQVRRAVADDHPFILGLVPRLVEFSVPRWRDAEAIERRSLDLLREALEKDTEDVAVLVAEDAPESRLGFIHVEVARDFFSGRAQGYVANLAISGEAEGRGVGRVLVEAAEAWTRDRGMRELTLYVFAGNPRARGFYERLGFEEDSLKVVKVLRE